jgi:glucokinase
MDILIDVGGTKTRVAIKNGRQFEHLFIFETKKDFTEELSVLQSWINEVRPVGPLRFILGLPGTLSPEKKGLERAPNLSQWENVPIKKILEETFSASVHLENDTALVGLGEAHFGAGQGYGIMAYVSVSTGVGGVRIVNGAIDESSFGFEPGHQIIEGQDLESQIGGNALARRFNKEPKEVTDQAVWITAAHTLAVGLYNMSLLWSPEVVVLGGSMVRGVPGISIPETSTYAKELFKDFPHPPSIISATLEDLGGLWGGVAYSEFLK